jgi:hypothetical protein
MVSSRYASSRQCIAPALVLLAAGVNKWVTGCDETGRVR